MSLLWQSIGVIVFGMTCWAAGDILLRRLMDRRMMPSALARHTLAFAAGNVFLSYLLTLLGFAGLFLYPVLWIVFLAGIGLTIRRIVVISRGHSSELPLQILEAGNPPNCDPERFAGVFLIGTVGLFLLPSILQAAAPPYVRDALVYHLLCPKEYLRVGGLVHIEGNLYSAFPKGQEVLMTFLLAIAGDRAAQGFSILQQMAAIGGLYSLARFRAGRWASALCTIGYATVPPVIYVTGCGYVEPALLMTIITSLLSLHMLHGSSRDFIEGGKTHLGTIVFIGLISGWMVALKYNGLIYFGVIGFVILWDLRKSSFKKACRVIGAFILGAAPGFCWMAWNRITLGNPVYPMAWFLLGGKGWDEARAAAFSAYFDLFGMGKSLVDYLLLPWRLAFSGKFDTILFDGAIGPFLLIFCILAVISALPFFHSRSHRYPPKGIGLMLVVSAAFFTFGTQQARFWLPAQLAACAYAASAMESLHRRTEKRLILKILLGLIVAASLLWNLWYLGEKVLTVGFYKPALGIEGGRTFLSRKVAGYPALEFINTHLPENSRLLCVWTGAYGYYINRPYYSDTFIEDVTLKNFINASTNGRELSQRLVGAGWTHLFVKFTLLEKNLSSQQAALLSEFLQHGVLELYRHQDFYVLAILRG